MNRIIVFVISVGLCTTPMSNAMSTDTLYMYFLANYFQYGGNFEASEQWYKQLLTNKAPVHIYKGYLPLLFETNRFAAVANLFNIIDQEFAHDADIQLLLAQALEKTGKQQEADQRFITLNNEFKNNQAIAFQAANIYMRKKEPENALATIEKLLNSSPKKPNNFIFYFLKSQIYIQMSDPNKALESVKTSLTLYPQFDKGWLLLALLEEQAGRLAEAIKGYSSFLELSPDNNQEIEQHLLQLMFKQKMLLQKSSSLSPSNSYCSQALSLFARKNYKAALEAIDTHLAQHPKDPENRLLKIQIQSAMNNHVHAAEQLKTWIFEDPADEIWYKTLYLLTRDGLKIQKAIALFEDIAKAHPNTLLPFLYLADLTTRTNHVDTALGYHKKALKLTNDARLKTKIYFQMALLYLEQHNIHAMEQALEDGFKLGMEFPPLLNLLAYHYATQNKKLALADQLVTVALQKNKNNPHFLDTKALIFYQQQQYEKALEILHTIVKQAPHDISILNTLGKTYFKVGERSKAVTTIEHAMNVAKQQSDKTMCANLLKEWNSRKR